MKLIICLICFLNVFSQRVQLSENGANGDESENGTPLCSVLQFLRKAS